MTSMGAADMLVKVQGNKLNTLISESFHIPATDSFIAEHECQTSETHFIFLQRKMTKRVIALEVQNLGQGFPNLSACHPQNNGARDWGPPLTREGAYSNVLNHTHALLGLCKA